MSNRAEKSGPPRASFGDYKGLGTARSGPANLASVFVCGLGVGWLLGLSASPTIQAAIAGLLAIVSAATCAMVGVKVANQEKEHPPAEASDQDRPAAVDRHLSVSAIPAAALVVGIVIGSSLGVVARTNEWLGADAARLVEKWRALGLDKNEVAGKLFDNLYSPQLAADHKKDEGDHKESPDKTTDSPLRGVLHSTVIIPAEECQIYKVRDGADLVNALLRSREAKLRQLAADLKDDPKTLKLVVRSLLCPD
jgi:hypothetical protein